MIHVTGDYSSIDRVLTHFDRMPDGTTRTMLNAALQVGFKATQAAVHVETGSLKASGRTREDVSKIANRWEGQIIYGGRSTGSKNNPVDYAIYEQRRGIGGAGGPSDAKGDHDFLRPMLLMDDTLFVAAIKAAMRP